ncbi:MAG: carbohydrate kinase, YjeF related protein [Candidatus Acidoferrum typicum]|nr:carbohydrate kinase, YjeF related protein [Candidatus Acidoferrum typicum]
MKVLTAAEMREVDRLTTERYGIPSLQLMETAGTRVADAYDKFVGAAATRPARIAVLCGKGNNGGDGLVAARHLQSLGAHAKVYLFSEPHDLRGDAATNLQRWTATGNSVISIVNEAAWQAVWPEISNANVILDAIFGTGFRGAATGAIAKAISDLNRHSKNATAAWPALILAVDTPSGLPSDGQSAEGPVLYAHKTVTFTAPKPGQLISRDSAAVGMLDVADIGSPASLIEEIGKGPLRWVEPSEFAQLPLVRTVDSHKGLYGHALVVGGSLGKSGAAVMAGYAALRAGAGLVTVAAPDVILPIVASAQPELMTEPLIATLEGTAAIQNLAQQRVERIAEGKTVLALGPGLGLQPETQDFIRKIVQQIELPLLLDADGLNAFAGSANLLRDRKTKFLAITPHPGEMARLLNSSTKSVQEDRVKTAREAASRWNAHVILKGSRTIIAGPDGKIFVNTSGNPGLAKGGSGDVLTGVLAALTAQFKTDDWTRILALGVYLHGKAAEFATKNTDESGLLATEVAAALPHARHQLLQELQARG